MKRSLLSRRTRSQRGFTLMEVLLVLVIITILGSFAVGVFSNTRQKALQQQAQGQIGTFKTPIEMYELDNNQFPNALEDLVTPPSDLANPNRWNGPYLDNLPADPWGREYVYLYPGKMNVNSYDIYSLGADGQEGTEDDIGNWQTND